MLACVAQRSVAKWAATLAVSWEKVTLQILQNPVSAKKATLTVSVVEKKNELTLQKNFKEFFPLH